MKLPRRTFLRLAAGAAALSALSRIARAQTYPTRPVRLILGYAPGGAPDIVARLIGEWLSQRFGQPFIIENRPGGASNIGTEAAVRSSPDGYTLLYVTTANAINATLYDKLNFNFINDIAPVASIVRLPYVVLSHSAIAGKTIIDFVAYAKANPGKINMASSGIRSPSHLSGVLFQMTAGVAMTDVPYRGAAPATTDLLSGQVQFYITTLAQSIEHIRSGELRTLGVTSKTRLDELPDVPTVREFLPTYEASGWWGVGGPKNTPAEIIDKLNKEINAGLLDPKITLRLADLGGTALPGSPADFGKLIVDDTEKWAKVIRAANIKAE
jgi:tripartite-type tricarboxylate transporter receptor subunit TctC